MNVEDTQMPLQRIALWNSVDPVQYDAVRPQYPDELLSLCASALDITPATRLLEVGAGTGIATRPLLRHGCTIDALEPDSRFATYIRAHAASPQLRVHEVDIEHWRPEVAAHHAVAANSWHWLEPHSAFRALRKAVRPDGLLAILEYHHCTGGTMNAFKAIDASWHCSAHGKLSAIPSAGEVADSIHRKWNHMHPVIAPTTMEMALPYSSSSYLKLLRTYPDMLALSTPERELLADAARTVIEALPDCTIYKNYLFALTVIRIEASRRQA